MKSILRPLLSLFLMLSMLVGTLPITAFSNSADINMIPYGFDNEDHITFVEVFEEEIYSHDAPSQSDVEISILTSTLEEPVGMQGFEGEYALSENSDEIIEIIVQFVTPPSVALRLLHERNYQLYEHTTSFDTQALAAHDTFQQQLREIPFPFDIEQIDLFGEHFELFNGVFMRLPMRMVSSIAELEEVFAVFPNTRIAVDVPQVEESMSDDSFMPLSVSHNLEARALFNIDYIHNELGITGAGDGDRREVIRVGVLDSGIYHNHPALRRYRDPAGGMRGKNFVRPIDRPGEIPAPFLHSHGTHVAGTIVAMAPDVELWDYQVLYASIAADGRIHLRGNADWYISAIEQARKDRMHIINVSLDDLGDSADIFSPINHALNMASIEGIVCVVSAGNAADRPFTISRIAGSALPISVGAGTLGGRNHLGDTIWNIPSDGASARGPVQGTFHIKPDIVAPGVQIHSTLPGGDMELYLKEGMALLMQLQQ